MRIICSVVVTSTFLRLFLTPLDAIAQEKSHVTSNQVTHAVQELEKLAQKKIQKDTVPGMAVAVVVELDLANPEKRRQQRRRDERRQNTAPGSASGDFAGLVDIGPGADVLECCGTGTPTVILESGYRNDADIWSA